MSPVKSPTPGSLPLLFGLLLGALALGAALGPLQGVPHVNDEIVYTLQARLFAGLARVGPPSAHPALEHFAMWVDAPVSYGVFPIGWPLLLALGEAVGAGWLVNPLLAVSLPVLTWLLVRERLDEATATLAALVMALSPGVWILAASRMSQTSVLAALLLAAVVAARGRDALPVWVAAAAAVAYVVLARPFDAVVLGLPLLLALAWRAPGLPARLALVALPGLAAAVVLLDNHAMTGNALTFPVGPLLAETSGRPGCNALGFGPEIGCSPTLGSFGHSPAKAVELGLVSGERLDRLLLGLPGGLLVAAVGLVLGLRRLWPLVLLGLAPVLAYSLYWSPGGAYGARFWHPAYLVLPALVALPLRRLLGRAAPLPVIALALLGLRPTLADLGDNYWCVDGAARDALAAAGADHGTVLVQARGEREQWWPQLRVAMSCEAEMELGDLMLLHDPLRRPDRLQVLRAPADREGLDALLPQLDGPVWLVQQDIASGQVRVLPVR